MHTTLFLALCVLKCCFDLQRPLFLVLSLFQLLHETLSQFIFYIYFAVLFYRRLSTRVIWLSHTQNTPQSRSDFEKVYYILFMIFFFSTFLLAPCCSFVTNQSNATLSSKRLRWKLQNKWTLLLFLIHFGLLFDQNSTMCSEKISLIYVSDAFVSVSSRSHDWMMFSKQADRKAATFIDIIGKLWFQRYKCK